VCEKTHPKDEEVFKNLRGERGKSLEKKRGERDGDQGGMGEFRRPEMGA